MAVPPTLADMTTLHLGGPARRVVEAGDAESIVAAVKRADARREPLLVLAGGSNLVVADEGFPGTVVRIRSRGIERRDEPGRALLRAQAGEPWDPFVAGCVRDGLAGVECLSGIPGCVGATPIQNVGAYGQEVAETVASVLVYDRRQRVVEQRSSTSCGFAYRSSIFKRAPDRWVVLAVTFALAQDGRSAPIRYPELARALGVAVGARASLTEVREAVLALRRAKGMVLDPSDPDTVSAGSFFTNPILERHQFETLEARVRERLGAGVRPPCFPEPDGRCKTSAAWLIERAGFRRGQGDPKGIAISAKHTLALTNRGRGTAAELVRRAREIADGVLEAFGVELVPEPVFVGYRWPARTVGRDEGAAVGAGAPPAGD